MNKKFTFYQLKENLTLLDSVKECDKSGIYKVIIPKGFGELLLDETTFEKYGIDTEKINKTFSQIDKKEPILYIGRAKVLKRRIKQYVKYGYNGKGNHRGGRYIFALKNWGNLLIEIICDDNYIMREADEIENFKNKHKGCIKPFANLKSGDKNIRINS